MDLSPFERLFVRPKFQIFKTIYSSFLRNFQSLKSKYQDRRDEKGLFLGQKLNFFIFQNFKIIYSAFQERHKSLINRKRKQHRYSIERRYCSTVATIQLQSVVSEKSQEWHEHFYLRLRYNRKSLTQRTPELMVQSCWEVFYLQNNPSIYLCSKYYFDRMTEKVRQRKKKRSSTLPKQLLHCNKWPKGKI